MKRNRLTIFLEVVTTLMVTGCAGGTYSGGRAGQSSLKETFGKEFLVGTAMNTGQIEERDTAEDRLIRRHFNAVTPENCMKSGNIHPQWDVSDYALADKLVGYTNKNNLKVNAHTLIWHSQLPAFVTNMKDADSLRKFFTDHINTVAG